VGICFEFLGEYEKAVSYYYKAIIASEKLGDKLLNACSGLNLGMVYFRMNNEKKAKN